MGMRATQHLAPDHAGHVGVGGVGGAACDLVGAIRAGSALADPLVVRIVDGHVVRPVPFGEACKIVHQSELVVTARSSTMRVRGSLKEEVTTMPHEVLRKILPVVGWSEDQAAAVAFTGRSDPLLPTPFRIGLAGAASVAAAGLGAARLWQAGARRHQPMTVGPRWGAPVLPSRPHKQPDVGA